MKKLTVILAFFIISNSLIAQMTCLPTPPNIISNHDFAVSNYSIPTPYLMGVGDHVCSWNSLFGLCFYYHSSNSLHYIVLVPTPCPYNYSLSRPASISQNVNIITGQKFNLHLDVCFAPPGEKSSFDSVLMDSIIVCFTNANNYFNNNNDTTDVSCSSQNLNFSKKIILDTSNVWIQVSQSLTHRNFYINNITADSNYNKLLIYCMQTDTSLINGTSAIAATTLFSVDLDLLNPFGAFAGYDTVICRHEPVTLGGNPSAWGGVIPYTYSWISVPSGFTSTYPNPTVTPNQNTMFILEVDAHDTNGNLISAFDTVNVYVNQNCLWPHWPELITNLHPYLEYNGIACDTSGNVTIFFFRNDQDSITIGGDTTIPYYSGKQSIAFFNKYGQLVWYNDFGSQNYCLVSGPQALTDMEGNIYFWFTSQKDYIFHTSESGGVGSWAQYLVKVNKLGVIQWIQSFSAQSNSVYDLPILSYCLLGDDLFLNGQASTSCELGNLTTKETGEFLCKVNKNSGEVIIANFFKQDIINGSIISINNKILLNEQNLFYLFDTTCNNIKIQTINNFTSSYLIQNGNNHFIAIQKLFLTSTIKGMMLDNNDSVSELWTKTFNYAINSLFTTDNFIYFNLENDTIYQIDQFGRFHNKRYREPYQGYICGSNNLEYGYTYGIHKQPGGDTLILDTIHFCTGLLMPIGIDTVQPIISKSNGQFKAFPNPTEKLLTISMDNNISGDLELYNSLGILLKRIQIIDNLKEYTLDLSSYPSGCYLIHLQSNSNSHTMKILKQN